MKELWVGEPPPKSGRRGQFRALGNFVVMGQGEHRTITNSKRRGPDPLGLELIEQITTFLRKALDHEKLIDMVEDLISAEKTFMVLIDVGYPHHRLLKKVSYVLDETIRLSRFEIVRRLLLGTATGEAAKECLSIFPVQLAMMDSRKSAQQFNRDFEPALRLARP